MKTPDHGLGSIQVMKRQEQLARALDSSAFASFQRAAADAAVIAVQAGQALQNIHQQIQPSLVRIAEQIQPALAVANHALASPQVRAAFEAMPKFETPPSSADQLQIAAGSPAFTNAMARAAERAVAKLSYADTQVVSTAFNQWPVAGFRQDPRMLARLHLAFLERQFRSNRRLRTFAARFGRGSMRVLASVHAALRARRLSRAEAVWIGLCGPPNPPRIAETLSLLARTIQRNAPPLRLA